MRIIAYRLETSNMYTVAFQKVVLYMYKALYIDALKCFLENKTVSTKSIQCFTTYYFISFC